MENILKNFGTKATERYSNVEMLNKLMALQSEIIRILESYGAPYYMKDRDILPWIEEFAKETGFDKTREFERLKMNISKLGYEIASLSKGFKGEEYCKKSLSILSLDPRVEILYNTQLRFGDVFGEYDAIVVAPYGLFVIEVKNWKATKLTITDKGILKSNDGNQVTYDLNTRMCEKEALLKRCLFDTKIKKYQSLLLLSNMWTEVNDEYQKIPIICGDNISKAIMAYDNGKKVFSDRKIKAIVKALKTVHQEQTGFCQVRCEDIQNDFSTLINMLNHQRGLDLATELDNQDIEADTQTSPTESDSKKKLSVIAKFIDNMKKNLSYYYNK